MPAISLSKDPGGAAADIRLPVRLRLAMGHMPVKRSINFATVGEKPIDWRVAAPAIALIIAAAAFVGKIAVVDRFAALNAARAEVYAIQAEISEKEAFLASQVDISKDYAHYTTSGMTEEEKDRVSRVTVMDVAQRLILPVDSIDAWKVEGNTLSIHMNNFPLAEVNDMVNRLRADPAVISCTAASQSATASSTEKVMTEETVAADVTVVFKGTLKTIEENKAAKAAAEAAAQTVVEEGGASS
ncbi:MAG: hypothetical protein IKN96_09095 [Oscillibacter sp.]|nr:hypothetical protein [Oscillibacter sp.]